MGSTSIRSAALPALLSVAVAVAGILAGFALGDPDSLIAFHQRYGLAATFVLMPLQTLISLSLSPVPSDVIGIAPVALLISALANGLIDAASFFQE
ncbi:MAG: hypothetical protein VCC00_14410 [Deltaproteobacteria bacterium]